MSSGENVPTHIMKQQQNKELHCPGNSAALQKEGMAKTVSSAPLLLSNLRPADKQYWDLETILWSLLLVTAITTHVHLITLHMFHHHLAVRLVP